MGVHLILKWFVPVRRAQEMCIKAVCRQQERALVNGLCFEWKDTRLLPVRAKAVTFT